MTINIWINRAGPSRIQAMRMLRDNPDGRAVTIHATRANLSNPSQHFCDVGGREPGSEASDEEYGQFAVDYVRQHKINVIVPTSRIAALAARSAKFAELGCVVMAPNWRIAKITDSKSVTYREAELLGVKTPPHFTVYTAGEFSDAVQYLRAVGYTACVKPDTGWAASSFRIIEDSATSMDSLLTSVKPVVDLETYATALHKAEVEGRDIPPLIVMPYLEEPEWSVDMLSTPEGNVLAAVPRAKSGWYREFRDEPEALAIAHRLAEMMPLAYLSNVQMRYLKGELVLLEVNPRASAGIFHTEATGVNLYWEAVKLAFDGGIPAVPQPRLGGKVLLSERAVPIN